MQIDPQARKEIEEAGIDFDVLIQNAFSKIEFLLQHNELAEAELIAKQLLVVLPDDPTAVQLYCLILLRLNRYPEAVEMLKKTLETDDSNAENHNNLALAYLHLGKIENSILHIEKAIFLSPDNLSFVNNKGLILRTAGRLDEAIECFKYTIELRPSSYALLNLGSIYGQKKEVYQAIDYFNKSIALDFNNFGAHVDLAYAYHLVGDWEKAWAEYEYRIPYWQGTRRFNQRYTPDRQWDGRNSLFNKKIVVYCEQGAGDAIQFARFLPKLKDLGADVIIEVNPELVPLFGDFGTVITHSDEVDYHYHCSILSLPYLLKFWTPDCFMKHKPYLFAEGTKMFDSKELKIGIAWAGNPAHPNDAHRSVYLKQFKKLSLLPNVKLFSFQKELSKRFYLHNRQEIDLTEDCEDMQLVDYSNLMHDYGDTRELLHAMDVIVTVDTSVLHLAGAMGKKTYGLIPYNPDWRWGLEGRDNVWYSSVQLIRQPSFGDWESVFEEVTSEIKKGS